MVYVFAKMKLEFFHVANLGKYVSKSVFVNFPVFFVSQKPGVNEFGMIVDGLCLVQGVKLFR